MQVSMQSNDDGRFYTLTPSKLLKVTFVIQQLHKRTHTIGKLYIGPYFHKCTQFNTYISTQPLQMKPLGNYIF
jgi:hypothetical protein